MDGFSYLEDLSAARAREWVKGQNDRTLAELERDPRFQRYYTAALESEQAVSTADARGLLPPPGRMWLNGEWIYQLWPDAKHPRGIWRRASVRSFLSHDPDWQVLLDVDALSATERQDWTFQQPAFSPSGGRALIQLSRSGSISAASREFDLERRAFVADGFQLATSREGQLVWRSDDSVLVTMDFGPGTLTTAGNPLIVKEWMRGQPLAQAKEIYRGQQDGLGVSLNPADGADGGATPGNRASGSRRVLHIGETSGANELTWWRLDEDGRLERLAAPLARSVPTLFADHYLIALDADWQTGGRIWKKGTVIAIPAVQIARANPGVQLVLAPAKDTSVTFVGARSKGGLLMFGSRLGDGRVWRAIYRHGAWTTDRVPLPDHGTALPGTSNAGSDIAFVRYESFLHPPALYQLGRDGDSPTLFASAQPQFNGDAFVVDQLEAKSADGVLVPYSVVRPKSLRFDGTAPTLIIAYGAYGGTYPPSYSATVGKVWLEQGGVYVVANVRGGRERGPAWHVTGVDRQHTYDDLVAVTQHLIARRVTTAKKVGFMGHSAGGLLGGVMLTQHPDLFGAIVLKAPVLDLLRMDLLAGGAAVRAREYGSLSVPAERAFLERTSPFQGLDVQRRPPKPLLITSSTDETVSAAHARRFAAKMNSMGMPFLYYETNDGGHGLAATLPQRARLDALVFTYLARQLIDKSAETD
jgi:prolyl oligopeptidase